jgi:hypothetical protein
MQGFYSSKHQKLSIGPSVAQLQIVESVIVLQALRLYN